MKLKFLAHKPFLFWILFAQVLAILPLMGLSVWAVHQLGNRIQKEAVAHLHLRTDVAAEAIAQDVERVQSKLRLLLNQEYSQEGNIDAVRRGALALMSSDPSVASATALNKSGRMIFSTQPAGNHASQKIKIPDGFDEAFETGDFQVTGLVVVGPDALPEITVIAPWKVNGNIEYVIRVSLKPTNYGDLLRRQKWPDNWAYALIDQNMLIVGRSSRESEFLGKPATESVQRLVKEGSADVNYARTKDGVEMATAIALVRGTSWWIVAGLPRSELTEEVAGPFRHVVAGGVLLTLLGLVASYGISRYLKRQITWAAGGAPGRKIVVRELAALGAQKFMLQNDLVAMTNVVNRRSTWNNPAMERIFGYGPGELDGHSTRHLYVDEESFESFGQRAYATIASGESHREQLQMVRKDGTKIWVDISGDAIADGSTLWIMLDVTAMRLAHEQMRGLALQDQLTELPNRSLLADRLRQCIESIARSQQFFAVCVLDLNGFKAVNDQLGHAKGDEILRETAARLSRCIRPNDTAARIGGDEFVLLLTQLNARSEVAIVVERVRQSLLQSIQSANVSCTISAAIGVSFYPEDGAKEEELLAVADARMYADKASSKNDL